MLHFLFQLHSCKKVSRTWRKIICEDAAALRRCQRAEQELGVRKLSQHDTDSDNAFVLQATSVILIK